MSGFVVRPETVPGPTHVRTGKVRDLRTAVDGHPVVGGDCVFGVTPTGARVGSELKGGTAHTSGRRGGAHSGPLYRDPKASDRGEARVWAGSRA